MATQRLTIVSGPREGAARMRRAQWSQSHTSTRALFSIPFCRLLDAALGKVDGAAGDAAPGSIGNDWSGRLDLNQRPPDPQSGALPGCATPRCQERRSFIPRAAGTVTATVPGTVPVPSMPRRCGGRCDDAARSAPEYPRTRSRVLCVDLRTGPPWSSRLSYSHDSVSAGRPEEIRELTR
jgi:hypothetical protein